MSELLNLNQYSVRLWPKLLSLTYPENLLRARELRRNIRMEDSELLTVGIRQIDYRLTGESRTDPTEFMFDLKRNSSPILRIISTMTVE